jgi:hypothetical protein
MAHLASVTYMRNIETDISQGNPYRVKTSSSLYDKYYLHSLHYHTYEHQLIVRLQPLFCKLQLVRAPTLCFSLAPTRRKHQLPVFKHPLEPLRTPVLPSTSQPPCFINLGY